MVNRLYLPHSKGERNMKRVSVMVLVLSALLLNGSQVWSEVQVGMAASLPDAVPVTSVASLPDAAPVGPAAACTHSHSVGGHPLASCHAEVFDDKDGNERSVSVYYTLDTSADDHWISSDAQAQNVGDWAREAWLRYELDADGVEPYHTGCGSNIDILIRDGPWGGIAWWASSGDCEIGINAGCVRGGGCQGTTYHEMQHYEQYGFDDCYDDWKSGYSGNAEFIEGYADYGRSTVASANWYGGNAYDPHTDMYDRSYGNRFVIYLSEQVSSGLGPNGSTSDPWYRSNGMYEHYRECENQDTLYVEDTIVAKYTPYSYKEFFMNFFAANWAMNWADQSSQPELQYWEDDANAFASPTLDQDVSMSGGTQSFAGESTPDHWAGRYYQVRPQSGCPYLMVEVDGDPGATLGINIMGADTGAPSVVRSAWVGQDFARTIAAYGVHDRVVAAVNAFSHNYSYDVDFTCVTPQLDIIEPRQTNFALVGDPASPIAFLARFRVMSGSTPVRGLPESSFTFDAGGDAVTVVAGTLQEIGGGEYWATLLPPTKPAGTTFVDFGACLDGTICDAETNALLYVAPGNSDIAILHDASGSMKDEDVIGEGTRLENAQKAATVWANLAQAGDRYAVLDFSAFDSPPGCAPDCPFDIQTHLPRTDITNPGTQIAAIESAIAATSAREWTPVGQGLVEAKDLLQAAPYSLNPKYIILLSDGEENIKPMYAAVQAEIVSSGVVVNTITFGDGAGAPLMAQIAADTGGVYRYVPSSTGSTMLSDPADQPGSTFYPGPLSLQDTYEYYDTRAQGAARVLHAFHTAVPDQAWRLEQLNVDKSVNTLRLVAAGKQADADLTGGEGYQRKVEVLPPSAGPREWIPISPPGQPAPPANWDIRNSKYVDVLIVPNPEEGLWQIRTRYVYVIGAAGPSAAGPPAVAPQALESDFVVNGSVQSTFRLEGRFLEPYEDGLGEVGQPLPILAALMGKTGTHAGASVSATIERPGGTIKQIQLWDDGEHGDGAAGDGLYGNTYWLTTVGGSYNVQIEATFPDPNAPATELRREWLGGFWIKGQPGDDDDDRIPTWWERLFPCMDPKKYDSQDDPDKDGLNNWQEWENNTDPCDPDTDDGGENDGSEVKGGRDPHWPGDDRVPPILHFSVRPLSQAALIRWTPHISFTNMFLRGAGRDDIPMGTTGAYTVGLNNDQAYSLQIYGQTDDGTGGPTDPAPVTPKADPDPPSGVVFINDDAPSTKVKEVTLRLTATDEPLGGMPSPGSAATIADRWMAANEVSGAVEMRISNDSTMAGAAWEPLAATVNWVLDGDPGDMCYVYAQFRDGVENESIVIFDAILLEPLKVYLPTILKGFGP
jgi:hypothetical protein